MLKVCGVGYCVSMAYEYPAKMCGETMQNCVFVRVSVCLCSGSTQAGKDL